MRRAAARSSREGETAATMAMWPLRARWVATSASRRMFSLRSCAEKPRSLLRPARKVSPSSSTGEPPLAEQPAFQRARQRRFAGARQSRQPDHRAVMTIARRAFVGTQRGFHRHDIDGNGALTGIDRQHQAAAGNAAVDLDHQAPGARIVGVGIGGDRLRQRNVDLADMIARDRLGLDAGEFAGIDRLLDRDHGGAGFPCAEPDQNRGACLPAACRAARKSARESGGCRAACCRHGR